MSCYCGHSIEEHEPECTECACAHYEEDLDEQDADEQERELPQGKVRKGEV